MIGVVLLSLGAAVSQGGFQVRSIRIPATEITFEGTEKLTEVPDDGFRPKRKDGPIIEYTEYENGDAAEVSIIAYVSRYRHPIQVDMNTLMMTLASTSQTLEEEEIGEAKVLKEETTTFGDKPGIHTLIRVTSEDGDFFMESIFIGNGSTETSFTLTYLDERAAKDQAEKTMKSIRVAGSPAGEMKPIKWEH